MNFLRDVITYVRRIIKTPNNSDISDDLIIDYINRFWIMDVEARIQLFDRKTQYQFLTTPGFDKYNMPLYSVQNTAGQQVGMFPIYQGFTGNCYINGVQTRMQTQREMFYNTWLNVVNNGQIVAQGTGSTSYTFQLPFTPNATTPPNIPYNSIIRGHVDLTGVLATGVNVDPPVASDATFSTILAQIPTTSIEAGVFITALGADGQNITVSDSGVFLTGNTNYGLLINPGNAPYGNARLAGDYDAFENTINYVTGEVQVNFPNSIPSGTNIYINCSFFNSGMPREILFYNNVITMRTIPALAYTVNMDAYLSPAAFFSTDQAIPFGYMAEYVARGAARKILSDTGDVEQFMFYEPLFIEQEQLVWKRSQRQFTANRTQTIYSAGHNNNGNGNWGAYT